MTHRLKRYLNQKWLGYVMWAVIILWIAIQVLVVLAVQDIPQVSDALRYQTLAEECFINDSWYPMRVHVEASYPECIYPLYICYPGLINLLELYLMVFGTIKAAFWMNILFNIVTLGSISYLAKKLGGITYSRIFVILFCLYPLQFLSVGCTLSEIPCIALIYLSLALATHKKYAWIIAAGVIIIYAQYIRTVALLFAIPLAGYMIMKNYGWKRVTTYVGTCIICCILLYSINIRISGYGFLSSSTLGANMVIGAYDNADGGYRIDDKLNEDLGPHLIGKNVLQIDSVSRREALKWIADNPGKWFTLIGPKLKYHFKPTSFIYLGREEQYAVFNTENKAWKPLIIFWLNFPWLYQYSVYGLALYGLWIRRKKLWGTDVLILFPLMGGILLTIFTVGHSRYNMPYMGVLIYFAAWSVANFKNKFKTKEK